MPTAEAALVVVTIWGGSGAGPAAGVPGLADNAEDFRFAEALASYAYGNSPQCGKPPH
jgi:hypothetical protein